MKIAIIAAMDKELALLLPLVPDHTTVNVNGFEYYRGHFGAHELVITRCGIGKVNAAISTLTLIGTFHPQLVINTGVAGGARGGAGVLDVVVADRVAYHDVWCGEGTKPGQAAGCPEAFECVLDDSVFEGLDVRRGLIASGDRFISTAAEVDAIKAVWPDAVAVDMESAAIAHVCYVKCVPFAVVRVISDTPGEADNISQYENFWTDAPERTFAVVKDIIDRLCP